MLSDALSDPDYSVDSDQLDYNRVTSFWPTHFKRSFHPPPIIARVIQIPFCSCVAVFNRM